MADSSWGLCGATPQRYEINPQQWSWELGLPVVSSYAVQPKGCAARSRVRWCSDACAVQEMSEAWQAAVACSLYLQHIGCSLREAFTSGISQGTCASLQLNIPYVCRSIMRTSMKASFRCKPKRRRICLTMHERELSTELKAIMQLLKLRVRHRSNDHALTCEGTHNHEVVACKLSHRHS